MRSGRSLLAVVSACALFGVAAPAASAAQGAAVPDLRWKACGDAGAQCATAKVPQDYDNPTGTQYKLAVARVPAQDKAHRIGSLFFNFGGPGGTAVDFLQQAGTGGLFDNLNQRFDIVGFDPRGVGQSQPSIDCKANQETQGIYSQPFTTPFNLDEAALLRKDENYTGRCLRLNGNVLKHVSTANVARDMDLLRQAVGDSKLSYLGFSYGTFLGSTYASLFPKSFRALVLDGPVDATNYINDPMQDLDEQTQGFERAYGRFMQACAAHQAACFGFGGDDPWDAYDQLVDQANAAPIPAPRYSPDPRPVDGDDINAAATSEVYAKQLWPELAEALSDAAKGDASLLRAIVDVRFYGNNNDGTFDPSLDRYFTIGATEQHYTRKLDRYFDAGDQSWGEHDHFYANNGYVELNYGIWSAHDKDAYDGPFQVRKNAPTPLVVATTYDPATPYRGALRLVRDLGNARLLTMRGDGHTAYGGNSPCIDEAVERYLNTLALPAQGTSCKQQVPFEVPQQVAARQLAPQQTQLVQRESARLHLKPLAR